MGHHGASLEAACPAEFGEDCGDSGSGHDLADQRQCVGFFMGEVAGQGGAQPGQRDGGPDVAGIRGQRAVDRGQQRVDLGVLTFHLVQQGQPLGVSAGQLGPRWRPDDLVFGEVVELELVREDGTAGAGGGRAGGWPPAHRGHGGTRRGART